MCQTTNLSQPPKKCVRFAPLPGSDDQGDKMCSNAPKLQVGDVGCAELAMLLILHLPSAKRNELINKNYLYFIITGHDDLMCECLLYVGVDSNVVANDNVGDTEVSTDSTVDVDGCCKEPDRLISTQVAGMLFLFSIHLSLP